MSENEISGILVDIFINVHKKLGPGLLESVYESAICYELDKKGLSFTQQQVIPVIYDEITLDRGFRADLIVENKVIVEIKSVEILNPVTYKIVLTYLRLSGIRLGLIANFSVPLMKDGITRLVNNL